MTAAQIHPHTTAYDRILDALRATVPTVRDNGHTAQANCPAHDDRGPSLSITRSEASALIFCHAGCDTDQILDTLGLTRRDLFDNPRGVTYRYDDGRLVHRTPDKKFRQSGNTTGKPQLYHLDAVKRAVADGRTIYLVEGEKDVYHLEQLGAVATTSPMGAANWGKVDATPLAGAHVIIVPDRDEPGMRYARAATATLHALGATVEIKLAATGKDATDHIIAGHTLDQLVPAALPDPDDPTADQADETPQTRIRLRRASEYKVRRVHWIWDGRIAYGTLALLAGREGLGKSTLAYQLAADITRGRLDGEDHGNPRAVIICASEDSWEHTIVPRLIAAGADLDLIYHIEVKREEGYYGPLTLPKDFLEVEYVAQHTGAGLMVLDPLMSVIDARLDTHRDREVRHALEPLVALADRTRMAILGLIHHNKSGSTDPLQLVMGSKAFSALARSVHTVVPDDEDDTGTRRIFNTSKNNLGRTDLPSLCFTITGHAVETEDDGTAWTGRLNWTGEYEGDFKDLMARGNESKADRTAAAEAADWLDGFLAKNGGQAPRRDVMKAGRSQGFSERTLDRAALKLRIIKRRGGFQGDGFWLLPDANPPVPPTVGGTGGGTGVADNSSSANPNTPSQSRQSRQTVAEMGDVGADLHKQSEPPHARTRARGDTPLGGNGELAELHTTPVTDTFPVPPIPPTTPRARTRDTPPDPDTPALPCRDCEYPLDSPEHIRICNDL